MNVTKLKQFENKLKANGLVAFESNVIIGFITLTSGRFMTRYSLSSVGETFDNLEDLIEFVITA